MDMKEIEAAQGRLTALSRLRLADDGALIFDEPVARADGAVETRPRVLAKEAHPLLEMLLSNAALTDLIALAHEAARIKRVLPEEIARVRMARAERGVAHDVGSRLRQAIKDGLGVDDVPLCYNAADELDRLTALERMLDALLPVGENEHRLVEKCAMLQRALLDAIELPKGRIPESAARLLQDGAGHA